MGISGSTARFGAAVVVTCGVLAGIAGPACADTPAAQAPLVRLDIAAGPLAGVLRQFATSTGTKLQYDADAVQGMTSPGLHGVYSIPSALGQILAGHGLAARQSRPGYFIVGKATDTITLGPVRVQGAAPERQDATTAMLGRPVTGMVAHNGISGTKTDTPLIKVPQFISSVTNDQMRLQNVQSVAEALRYTAGVNSEVRGTNNNALQYLYARGFLVDEFWNGLHTPGPLGGFGYNVTTYDPYLLERVEFLHGPSSVLYGQGSPGGTINLVSKMPTATRLHEIGVETGNYGRVQGFMDFAGAIDRQQKWLYRLTFDAFRTGTAIDHIHNERFAVAPSLTWRPTDDTSLTVYAQYQADPDAGSYNSVPAVGTVLPGKVSIPRRLDASDPSFDSLHKMQESIGYIFEHRFSHIFSFRQSYRFLHNSAKIAYLQTNGYATADQTSLARIPYLNQGTVNAHTLDNQFSARFRTGPVSQHILVGVDYQNMAYDHDFYAGSSAPALNIRHPVYGLSIPSPALGTMLATSGAFSLQQAGLYAQDQIDIKHWSFLLGLREDWAGLDFRSFKTGKTTYDQFTRAFTWRAGGVYQFDNGLAPYFSYATSFQPQTGSDYGGNVFKPTTGEQYEAGIKFQPRGMNAFVTASAFHLMQNNVATTDPLHAGFSILTGQIRSQGFEVEAHADLTKNLQLIGSYTYTDLLNTRSNTAHDKSPVGIPRNAASLWLDYTVDRGAFTGLQLSGGARYVGSSYGSVDDTLKVPSAVVADLAVRYELGNAVPTLRGTTLSFNMTNLADNHYISSCSSTSFCTWAAGRQIIGGLKYRW